MEPLAWVQAFESERPIVEGKEDGVYGRRHLRGPHKEDNEIQLLSVAAKGHKELHRPGASALILPGRARRCHVRVDIA